MPASSRRAVSGGATEPRTDIRASSASWSSGRPCARRAISYCAPSRDPNSSGSSAPSATGTPSPSSVPSGTAAASGATPRATLDAGQTSRVILPAASRLVSSASPAAATPCPIRSACRSSRQARTLAGPHSSPPCGVSSSPDRAAMRNAAANSAAPPRRSSLLSPNPITPRPAYCAASRASVRASSGCLVRLAAMIRPMPTPVAVAAACAASSTSSTVGVRPPKRCP